MRTLSGLERHTYAETRFIQKCCAEFAAIFFEFFVRNIKNRYSHAAGNIHADSIRNHCVFSRQHAADRETVTLVSIRHQSASDGNRQTNSLIHLFKRSGFDLFCAPQLPRCLFFPLAVNDSATSEFLQFFYNFEIFSNFFRDIYLLQDFCRIGRYRQFADQRF